MASAEENYDSSDKEEGGEIQLEMMELTLGTLDLREHEIHPSRHRRRRRRKKEEAKMQNDGRSSPVYHHVGGCSYILRIKGMCISHQKLIKVFGISYPTVSELSNTETHNQEEDAPEATQAEDATDDTNKMTQSKNKRKRKAQSKKQLEGD